uniref:Uncharacterized protein n=1 Tax=Anguilla anguilla TaxID=7936 RepID=A0A0E9PWR8_ANGAN
MSLPRTVTSLGGKVKLSFLLSSCLLPFRCLLKVCGRWKNLVCD